jgi:hypothetical protein
MLFWSERPTCYQVIHSNVYFPIYSNGLKDIGRFLQFERAKENVTGLQSIVWRMNWEVNKAADVKAQLLQYNQNDCRILKHICEFIGRLASTHSVTPAVALIPFKTAQTANLTEERPRWDMFGSREYTSVELKEVFKCVYFDYQRERIYVRTHPHFKVIDKKHRKFRRAFFRINKVSAIEIQRCPECQSKKIEKGKQMSHDLIDLKLWLANRYFSQDSSGFSVLLRFLDAQSCRSFHPFHRRPG